MKAQKYLGKPCKRCSSTERYSKGRKCVACVKSRASSYYAGNKDAGKISRRLWRERNPDKVAALILRYKGANQANIDAYQVRYRQERADAMRTADHSRWRANRGLPMPTRDMPAKCERCGEPPKKQALHLDHCHETGIFRGWLCFACNTGLGKLGDTEAGLLEALNYLRRAYGKPEIMNV